jgi:small subunit ribosomal protein S16
MLIIRLQRTGKRNASDFRVVLAEKESHVSKKVTEVLGSYNPKTKDLKVKDQERLTYWIGQRVSISPTVHNLLVSKGLLDSPKVRAFNTPKKDTPAAETLAATPAPVAEAASEEAPKADSSEEAPAVTAEQPVA